MEEKDFQRIEQMIGNAVQTEVGKAVKIELTGFREEFESKLGGLRKDVNEDFQRHVDAKLGQHRKDVNEDFRHHIGIISEDFQHKLQVVAEGHQMLSEKMDRMHGELSEKIDAVASDLVAHRADTEGHKQGYQVSEP